MLPDLPRENLEIRDIDLPHGLLGANIGVCVVQLRSPFFEETYRDHFNGQAIFSYLRGDKPYDYYERRLARIDNLLQDISNMLLDINIIVFPEYCLDRAMIEDLKLRELSLKGNVIIVGNFYAKEDRKSTTFVIVPDSKQGAASVHYEIKQDASTHDAPYLTRTQDLPDNERYVLRFWWSAKTSSGNQKAFLQILTCIDFPHLARRDKFDKKGKRLVEVNSHGIILVPSCTPTGIAEWHGTAEQLLRDAEDNKKTIVTVFCNCVDLPKQRGINTCGQSQLVTVADDMPQVIDGRREAILFCRLEPFDVVLKKTPATGPNRILFDSKLMAVNDDGKLQEGSATSARRANRGVTVNPLAFDRLNLSMIYMLFRLDNYYSHKNHLMNADIGTHGVFGFHDVLCKSLEEQGDSIENGSYVYQRLKKTSRMLADSIKNPYLMKVKRRVKHHGVVLANTDANKQQTLLYPIDSAINVKTYLTEIQKVRAGQEISPERRETLLKNHILLRVDAGLEQSDVSPEEPDYEEYLVFVTVTENAALFEQRLLPHLQSNPFVRTIEEITESTKGDTTRGYEFETHWVLHVVGTIEKLRETVVETVHKEASEYGLKLATRVILPAQLLSLNKSPVLYENILTRHEDRTIIKSYISGFLQAGYPDPFAIRRLHEETTDKLIIFYRNSEEFIDGSLLVAETKARMKIRRDDFAYGLARTLSWPPFGENGAVGRHEADLTPFQEYCKSFYCDDLAKAIEKACTTLTRGHADKVGMGVFLGLLNAEMRVSENRDGKRTTYSEKALFSTSDLGDHIQMAALWNRACEHIEKLCKDDPEVAKMRDQIDFEADLKIDTEIVDGLKLLQKNRTTEIRNRFVHDPYTGHDLPTGTGLVMMTLNTANLALEFLLRHRQLFAASQHSDVEHTTK